MAKKSAPSEDAQIAADALLPLFRSVAPGALEKAEILERSGMESDEVREGLDVLLSSGRIEGTDDGLRLAHTAEPAARATPDDPDTSDEDEEPREPDPASPAAAPGAQSYRATFTLTATYGGAMRDEAALQKAAAMEEEIVNVVHELYPHAVIAVDVTKVEAYKPRVIFGGDEEGGE